MSDYDYDLFVIGGGSGGVRAARIAAELGAKVGIAEQDRFGGTCVIRGCVPKKLMVHAARFSDEFAEAAHFGWRVEAPRFDWSALIAGKDREIAWLESLYIKNLEKAGVKIHASRAVVEDPHTIRLLADDTRITAGKILIATGGAPDHDASLPGAGFGIASNDVFHLPQLPQRIVIVGGGYIAIEFASMLRGFGADVTLINRGAEILSGFDAEAAVFLRETLTQRGVQMHLNAKLARIEKTDSGMTAALADGTQLEADQVLFAIGRRPNTRGFGLEDCGVKLDERSRVIVDEDFRSSVPSIFAVGDVSNDDHLTPVAIREGQAFAQTQFGNKPTKVDYSTIPTVVFSTPECGKAGLTEAEARKHGGELDIYETRFVPLTASMTARREKMLMKMIVEQSSQRVLGVHIVGPHASEMVQLLAIPLKMGATKSDFDAVMALHPTSAEELVTLKKKRG